MQIQARVLTILVPSVHPNKVTNKHKAVGAYFSPARHSIPLQEGTICLRASFIEAAYLWAPPRLLICTGTAEIAILIDASCRYLKECGTTKRTFTCGQLSGICCTTWEHFQVTRYALPLPFQTIGCEQLWQFPTKSAKKHGFSYVSALFRPAVKRNGEHASMTVRLMTVVSVCHYIHARE